MIPTRLTNTNAETFYLRAASYIIGAGYVQGGYPMNAVEVQAHARKLFEVHGPKALAEAAQMVRQFEERNDTRLAEDWRRIEKALQQLRGPGVS